MGKILVLTRRFYPPWSDGVASYSRGVVDALSYLSSRLNEHEIYVFSMTDETWFPKLQYSEMDSYIRSRKFEMIQTPLRPGNFHFIPKSAIRELNGRQYDIVHITYTGLDPALLEMSFLLRGIMAKNCRIWKHMFVYPTHSTLPLEVLHTSILRRLSKLHHIKVAWSSNAMREIYNCPSGVILPPAIDTQVYSPRRVSRDAGISILERCKWKCGNLIKTLECEYLILYMGPLTSDRVQLKRILASVSRLSRSGDDIGMLFIGRGFESIDRLRQIQRHIDGTGTNSVFFGTRPLTDSQKAALFNFCDVFFYPVPVPRGGMSVVSPPIAILEAMACGKIVVTGGSVLPSEIVDHGSTGYFLPQLRLTEISSVLGQIFHGNSEEVKYKSRELVEKSYAIPQVANIYRVLGAF